MKNLPISLILAVTALLLTLPASAQRKAHEGYIILNSGDTLNGDIAIQSDVSNSLQCLFKSAEDEKFQTYTPDMITEYRFSRGRKFISAITLGIDELENGFLEFLVNGRFSTFAYYSPDLNVRFFGRIENGNVFELKNTSSIFVTEDGTAYSFEKKEYIGTLNYSMQDYPNTSERIHNMALNRSSLVKLAKDYHQYTCPDSECVVYIAEKRIPELKVGIISSFSHMWVKAPWETNILVNTLPGFGISMNLTDLPLISKNFSFQTDFLYSRQLYEYDREVLDNSHFLNMPNELFTISSIRIPVVLKYSFKIPRVRPFLGVGASFSFREIEYTGLPYLINRSSKGILNTESKIPTQMGLNLQAGANMKINRNFSIEYAAIAERNGRFFSTYVSDLSITDQLIHCLYLWYKF
jgi:hypothetical protein